MHHEENTKDLHNASKNEANVYTFKKMNCWLASCALLHVDSPRSYLKKMTKFQYTFFSLDISLYFDYFDIFTL